MKKIVYVFLMNMVILLLDNWLNNFDFKPKCMLIKLIYVMMQKTLYEFQASLAKQLKLR